MYFSIYIHVQHTFIFCKSWVAGVWTLSSPMPDLNALLYMRSKDLSIRLMVGLAVLSFFLSCFHPQCGIAGWMEVCYDLWRWRPWQERLSLVCNVPIALLAAGGCPWQRCAGQAAHVGDVTSGYVFCIFRN